MRFKQHCHHRLPYRLWHLSVHRGYHCFDTNIVVKINRIILVQHKFPPPALSPQQFSTSLPPSPLYLPLPPATTTAALHCLPIPLQIHTTQVYLDQVLHTIHLRLE